MDGIQGVLNNIQESIINPVLSGLDSQEFIQIPLDAMVRVIHEIREVYEDNTTGHDLYSFYEDVLTSYVGDKVLPLLANDNVETILESFLNYWETYKHLVYWLKKAFLYMEKHYIPLFQKDSLTKLGLEIFRQQAFHQVAHTLGQAVLLWIDAIRQGHNIDEFNICQAVNAFIEIDLEEPQLIKDRVRDGTFRLKWKGEVSERHYYKEFLEAEILRNVRTLYRQEARELSTQMVSQNYLERLNQIFSTEDNIADRFFHETTKDVIKNAIIQELIDSIRELQNTQGGLESLSELFDVRNRHTLRALTALFPNDRYMDKLFQKQLEIYLDIKVNGILSQLNNLSCWDLIRGILDLDGESRTLVEKVFHDEYAFRKLRTSTIQKALNDFSEITSVTAEYCDTLLKKKDLGELDPFLYEISQFINNLRDKELMVAHYSKFLAKRLLSPGGFYKPDEEQMISYLKESCGVNTTSKLTTMVNDISISEDIDREYRTKNRHGGSPFGFEVSFKILQKGAWPEPPMDPLIMPSTFHLITEDIDLFYSSYHQRRKLTFIFEQSSIEVRTLFTERDYTLLMNGLQCVMLLHFNENNQLSLKDLKELTGMPIGTLKKGIFMFFNPKYPLLVKRSDKKSLKDDEPIGINFDFEFKKNRIDFTAKPKAKRVAANPAEEENALKARKLVIESAIVRVAKAHRRINHANLVAEVLEHASNIKVPPEMVKERIEELIVRGLLRRDDRDPKVYIYVAE